MVIGIYKKKSFNQVIIATGEQADHHVGHLRHGAYRGPAEEHLDPGPDQADQALHSYPDPVNLWRVEHRDGRRGELVGQLHPGEHQ